MLQKNIITKIALGVAAVAFLFSVITLIRAIVIGAGVMFAVIQVIGTLIIVAICVIMLYFTRFEETEDEDEEETKDQKTEIKENSPDDLTQPEDNESILNDTESEIIEPDIEDDKYNFNNFE